MTEDEAIDIAVRLDTAIGALLEAFKVAEGVEHAPIEHIAAAHLRAEAARDVCVQAVPALIFRPRPARP